MNRRDFLQAASVSAAVVSSSFAVGAVAPAVKPVRLGVIGAGSRGQEDMRQFLHVPGVSIAAICDVYPPRYAQVNRLAGAEIPATASASELLARSDIDAVLIASPLSLHAQHVIAAARSGPPIFSEKALGFTVEDNQRIVDEVQRRSGACKREISASRRTSPHAGTGTATGGGVCLLRTPAASWSG